MDEVAAADYEVLNKCCESVGIKKMKLKNVQRQKKLCLILDLDHTLIHSIDVTRVDNFTRLQCSFGNADILQRNFKGVKYMIKLRPFVRKFLKEASNLFEMYIYTLGTRDYALGIASILDPRGLYLGSRIISSQDSTEIYEKSLDVVPDVDELFWMIWSAGALSFVLEVLKEVHGLYIEKDNLSDTLMM